MKEHGPSFNYDGEFWLAHCECGKFLGSHETFGEATDAFEDHAAGISELQPARWVHKACACHDAEVRLDSRAPAVGCISDQELYARVRLDPL